jgi:hypothetical protein
MTMMSAQETRLPRSHRAVGRATEVLLSVEALSFALASVDSWAAFSLVLEYQTELGIKVDAAVMSGRGDSSRSR